MRYNPALFLYLKRKHDTITLPAILHRGFCRKGGVKCMVKLIYDFKQRRDTVSNTANAQTGTSIYQSADTRTKYCAFSALCTQILL